MIDSFFWRQVLARSGVAKFLPSLRRSLGGAEAFLHQYSQRTLALPVDQLNDPALLPTVTTPDAIDLALGSPVCDIAMGLGRGLNDRRPTPAWGNLELRADLANEFHLNHGIEHDPREEMLITHGATGAFAATLDAFVNPGDRVVMFDPTSPLFAIGLKHRRAKVNWVPTWSDRGRVRFAMDAFAKAIRGAKLLVLADPVNPTGCVFAPEDLEQIAFWAKKHDAIIYQDASFDRWRSEPAKGRLAALPHAAGRLLTCGSFAKSHGLTAARVGWLTGHRHLVLPAAGAMLMAAPFVPSLCQYVALQAMRGFETTMLALREELNQRREYVREQLLAMGLQPWDSMAGFFLWVPIPTAERSRPFAQDLLRQTGVLVNPGAVFGPSGDAYLRISFATDEGRVVEGLKRLAGTLGQRENEVGQRLPFSADSGVVRE